MLKTQEDIKEDAGVQEQPTDNWDDLRDYMKIKEQKLLSQFHSIGIKLSNIFKGVSIYVNGFTEPKPKSIDSRPWLNVLLSLQPLKGHTHYYIQSTRHKGEESEP